MKSLIIGKAEVVFNNIIGRNALIGVMVGLIFTAVVQSSSITTSLLVPLMGAGIITIEQLFPLVIGANLGTTVTAILASFATGNILAITVAFVHLLFNITGALVLYPLRIMRQIPISLARSLAEISARRRRYALIYVGCVFFLIPGLLIFISRLIIR
jgi:sodium-dependent phosphate cotransporter